MTRDEAKKIVEDKIEVVQSKTAYQLVDALVALGMLKLDEPMTLDQRINTTLNKAIFSGHASDAGRIKLALDASGLKIVEK